MKQAPICKLALLLLGSALGVEAQHCLNPPSLAQYLRCEILAAENSTDETFLVKQAEAPSASLNSTALADSSSSPDLLGLSVNPALFGTRSLSPNANDFSGVVNLYGIYALATHSDPFGLKTYESTSLWRRFSISVDHSNAADDRPSDLVGNTNTYMAKAVLFGFRDVAAKQNYDKAGAALTKMTDADQQYAQLVHRVIDYLYATYGRGQDEITFTGNMLTDAGFQTISLTRADRKAIGDLVTGVLNSQTVADKELAATLTRIQSQLQISADFTSRISYSGGANLYRGEAIMDKGFKNGAVASTTNLSYDFQNSQSVATRNRDIIRVVEAIAIPIKGIVPWTSDPLVPSFSGEGDYGTNGTPIYKGQFKATIPLRLGWALPLVFQYTNRTAVGPRADIKAQIGLTFDLDKAIVDSYALEPRRSHSFR